MKEYVVKMRVTYLQEFIFDADNDEDLEASVDSLEGLVSEGPILDTYDWEMVDYEENK